MWSTFSQPLFPDTLWPEEIAPIKFQSMGKNDLFKNYLYFIRPCVKKKNAFKKQLDKKQ